MTDNQYVIENWEIMKKENGVWYCIELVADDKSMVVMADGYPYARFVAIRFEIDSSIHYDELRKEQMFLHKLILF